MKETTELFGAVFATLNTVKTAASDGKLDLQDLPLLLPLIFDWQKAIQNLTFAQEARAATPDMIDAAFATAGRKLTAWTPEQAAGFVNLLKGLYYGYWLAANAGFDAGFNEATAKAKLTR